MRPCNTLFISRSISFHVKETFIAHIHKILSKTIHMSQSIYEGWYIKDLLESFFEIIAILVATICFKSGLPLRYWGIGKI